MKSITLKFNSRGAENITITESEMYIPFVSFYSLEQQSFVATPDDWRKHLETVLVGYLRKTSVMPQIAANLSSALDTRFFVIYSSTRVCTAIHGGTRCYTDSLGGRLGMTFARFSP